MKAGTGIRIVSIIFLSLVATGNVVLGSRLDLIPTNRFIVMAFRDAFFRKAAPYLRKTAECH